VAKIRCFGMVMINRYGKTTGSQRCDQELHQKNLGVS
jgi:hypothetical protein